MVASLAMPLQEGTQKFWELWDLFNIHDWSFRCRRLGRLVRRILSGRHSRG